MLSALPLREGMFDVKSVGPMAFMCTFQQLRRTLKSLLLDGRDSKLSECEWRRFCLARAQLQPGAAHVQTTALR